MLSTLWLLLESFRLALLSLRANKLRTLLTLLGVIVGVTSVIAVITIISGLDTTVATAFSSQGSTVFSVAKRPLVITSREDMIRFNRRKEVTKEDAEAVMRLCRSCSLVGMALNGGGMVKFADNKSEGVSIRGLSPSMFDIENTTIQSGRRWTDQEGSGGRNVCVIGTDLLENIFNGRSADSVVGEVIRVDGRPYEVLGVASPFGKVLGFSRDNFVYIPFQASQKIYGARSSITIHIKVENSGDLETAQDEVRAIMRNRRGKAPSDVEDGFSLETQDAFLSIYKSRDIGHLCRNDSGCRCVAGRRRDRRDEYHARVGHRTDQGDRATQGSRSPEAGHFAAVFDRSGIGNGSRRVDRDRGRLWAGFCFGAGDGLSGDDPRPVGGDGRCRFPGRRHRQRTLSGDAGGKARPDRCDAE